MTPQPITTIDTTELESQPGGFSSFDRVFQNKIVQAMLWDRHWAAQFVEVLDTRWFEHQYLTLIAQTYTDLYKQHRSFPSQDLLISVIKSQLKSGPVDQTLKNQVVEFFRWVIGNPDLGDLKYVQETAMTWCRRQAVAQALQKSCDLVYTDKFESVAEVIKKALVMGTTTHSGLDLAEHVDSRYDEALRKTIPTGVPELDTRKILNGGLASGEIGIVVAPSGKGKSHLMVHFGATAVSMGKNVVHYTFELRDNLVGIRYDSHLTGIPSLECWENKDQIREWYRAHKKTMGRLFIKEYPTSTVTCQTLRNHLERLAVSEGFKPDLLIIDYMGIMRSTDKYDLPRMELKRIAEELRALSSELDVPVWTCVQSNKEGANSEIIDSTNLAESYAQAAVADVILTLQRKSSEGASGYGNIFVAKNRAGIDGIQFAIHLDTSRSKLRILTEDEMDDYNAQKQQVQDSERERSKIAVTAALKRALRAGTDSTKTLDIKKVQGGGAPKEQSLPEATSEFIIFPDLKGGTNGSHTSLEVALSPGGEIALVGTEAARHLPAQTS